jgi:hypothetical protein
MNTLARGAAPLTFVTIIALLQAGGAAGWWQTPVAPAAFAGFAVGLWILGVFMLAFQDQPRPAERVADQLMAAATPVQPETLPPIRAGRDRRAHLRYDVTHPVLVEVRGMPSTHAVVKDISEGGARIAHGPNLAPGARGLLHIDGVALAVPFNVVNEAGAEDLRVKFDLEGLARDAFLRQFHRLLIAAGAVPKRDERGPQCP